MSDLISQPLAGRTVAAVVAAVLLAASGGSVASAATATTNLPVRFKLVPACTISLAAAMDFGSFNADELTAGRSAEGSVTVKCATGTPWFASASTGLSPDGTGQRRMRSGVATSGAYTLPYKIYTTAAGTVEFPTATGTPGSGASGGTGTGADQTVKLYGRIAPFTGTLPKADLYSDTVVVTLNW